MFVRRAIETNYINSCASLYYLLKKAVYCQCKIVNCIMSLHANCMINCHALQKAPQCMQCAVQNNIVIL